MNKINSTKVYLRKNSLLLHVAQSLKIHEKKTETCGHSSTTKKEIQLRTFRAFGSSKHN
jgi:hypothetical protein